MLFKWKASSGQVGGWPGLTPRSPLKGRRVSPPSVPVKSSDFPLHMLSFYSASHSQQSIFQSHHTESAHQNYPKHDRAGALPGSAKGTLHKLPLELDSNSNSQFNLWLVSQGVRRGRGNWVWTGSWESPCHHLSFSPPKMGHVLRRGTDSLQKGEGIIHTVILLAWFKASTQSFRSFWSLAWRKYLWERALMTAIVMGKKRGKTQVRTHARQKDSTKLRCRSSKVEDSTKQMKTFVMTQSQLHEYQGSSRL